MTVAVSVTPSSGVARSTVCRVDVTGLANVDTAAYSADADPSEPEIRYYFQATAAGQTTLTSHQFSPSQDGKHTWYTVVLPAAGTWTFAVKKVSDNSSSGTTTFVAS